MEPARVLTGTVRWFDVDRGYGFVARADGGGDVFVHHTAIMGPGPRRLAAGSTVRFELELDERGSHASRVRVAEERGPV